MVPKLLRATGIVLLALALAAPASAVQEGPTLESEVRAEPESSRRWWTLWTETSDRDRLLWAMWTLHIHHLDEGWSNDGAVALVYRGMYAATFETTHGPRAYSVGFERDWLSGRWGPLGAMVGFRTGLVYGYDGRLGWMAEKFPILPVAQPLLVAEIGPLTTDLTYTWVVLSLSGGVRF